MDVVKKHEHGVLSSQVPRGWGGNPVLRGACERASSWPRCIALASDGVGASVAVSACVRGGKDGGYCVSVSLCESATLVCVFGSVNLCLLLCAGTR